MNELKAFINEHPDQFVINFLAVATFVGLILKDLFGQKP